LRFIAALVQADRPAGGTLRQIVQRNTRFDRIRTAVEWLRGNASESMCVKQLAASVALIQHLRRPNGVGPRDIRLPEKEGCQAFGF
jgi:hypothetical protein